MPTDSSFVDELQTELDEWQRRGLIGTSQVRRIRTHYGLAPRPAEDVRSKGRLALLLGGLGAVLVGVGVILFVAANWQQLDRPLKVGLLLGLLASAYGVGFWLRFGPGENPRIGGALIFLGSLIFGANVFLLAQIYHVRAGEPMLLAWWAAGTFAVAYVAGSRGSLYLALLVAVIWYPSQLAAWDVERLANDAPVALSALVPYGLLMVSCGELQRSFRATRGMATAWEPVGLVVALTPVWVLSFASFWWLVGRIDRSSTAAAAATASALLPVQVSFGVIAAAMLVLTLAATWRYGFSRVQLVQAGGTLALAASSLLALFHPFVAPAAYAVVFNLVLLVAILWAIVIGLWTRREAWINIGLIFFVLLVVARYFDLFFGLMDRSLAFIVAGVALLAGGYLLERSRRGLLRTMRRAGVQEREVDDAT